jgi:hypothetical protein
LYGSLNLVTLLFYLIFSNLLPSSLSERKGYDALQSFETRP